MSLAQFKTRAPRILIIGSGIGGLRAAISFARQKTDSGLLPEVTLLSKLDAKEGSTRYAQGGIASVWSKQDSFSEHVKDTLVAGAGLCNEKIVEICVTEGPARVQELIDLGVEFTKVKPASTASDNQPTDPTEAFDLHREGGHGQRRILHAADLTGLAIEEALFKQVQSNPQIRVLEHYFAIDLITEGKLHGQKDAGRCLGAYALNAKNGKVETFQADVTVLATGGAGKVYLYTSNPDIATGDGIAMAHRAQAEVANLEFMQFHPTCLFHPEARTFLISEALRGEGAELKNLNGVAFMKRHHPMGSLAPRDIVARAIDLEMKRTGHKHVWLDATHLPREELIEKFPNIYQTCLKYGIDLTKSPIPVVPACHYTCGGVRTNEWAETSIEGLYAVGEVASTGLHGANRLASNSLLEAVVFATRAVDHAWNKSSLGATPTISPPRLPEWDIGRATPLEEQIDIATLWLEIRSLMWNYVGIVRSDRRLERAERRLALIQAEVDRYYWDYLPTRDLLELRNLLTVARLIVECAKRRKESRGLHYTSDYPETNDQFKVDTVL